MNLDRLRDRVGRDRVRWIAGLRSVCAAVVGRCVGGRTIITGRPRRTRSDYTQQTAARYTGSQTGGLNQFNSKTHGLRLMVGIWYRALYSFWTRITMSLTALQSSQFRS